MAKQSEIFSLDTPLEQEVRHNHEENCKLYGERTGDYRGRLFVKRTARGWQWHCHNCGVGGFKRYSIQDYRQLGLDHFNNETHGQQFQQNLSTEEGSTSFHLPSCVSFFPKARRWLQKYGITEQERENYGLYCTEEYGGRLVMPLRSRDGTRCVGMQLRKLSDDSVEGQKYLTYIRKGETNVRFRTYTSGGHSCICVVEDIVSAIKVGRYVPTLGLLGTWKRLPNVLGLELADTCSSVLFWLDPNKTGVAIDYSDRCRRIFGLKSRAVIWLDGDPKDASDSKIQRIING